MIGKKGFIKQFCDQMSMFVICSRRKLILVNYLKIRYIGIRSLSKSIGDTGVTNVLQ